MPKMKISTLMFYSTILTSVMLSSCSQHAQTHSALENTASNYAQKRLRIGLNNNFAAGVTKLTSRLIVKVAPVGLNTMVGR